MHGYGTFIYIIVLSDVEFRANKTQRLREGKGLRGRGRREEKEKESSKGILCELCDA